MEFYVNHDGRVDGPFTGVEVREAALAKAFKPDAEISDSKEGPWQKASEVGIFDSSGKPIDHPAGTIIPEYMIKRRGKEVGPLRLNQLITMACLREIDETTQFRSSGDPNWGPIMRIGVVAIGLAGHIKVPKPKEPKKADPAPMPKKVVEPEYDEVEQQPTPVRHPALPMQRQTASFSDWVIIVGLAGAIAGIVSGM